jgi:predicted PurR-regulated permease PerM
MLFAMIFYVLGASIARFSAGISSYSSELDERLAPIQVLVDRLGLTSVKLRDVVEPRALTGAVGVILSGIAGFLSNLFLILMIVLFLLAEGPARHLPRDALVGQHSGRKRSRKDRGSTVRFNPAPCVFFLCE